MNDKTDKNTEQPDEQPSTVTLGMRTLFYLVPFIALVCGLTGIVNRDIAFITAISMLCVQVLIESTLRGLHSLALLVLKIVARKTDT